MTTENLSDDSEICPAQRPLKLLSGKWKPEILRLAVDMPLRFSSLLRQIKGSSRQSLALALRELEGNRLLKKVIIKQKPLHIEYHLTERGRLLSPIFKQLEKLL